jgi:hypothetical protein
VSARVTPPAPSLTKEEIRAGMNGALPGVQRCYERALGAHPRISGRLVLRFSVAAQGGRGVASCPEIAESSLANPELEACIVAAVSGAEFPAPRGEPVVVTYPFVLRAAQP